MTDRNQLPLTFTIDEVATRLGISRTLAYELAQRGALPAPVIRLGRRLVVGRVALERALAGELRNPSGGPDGRAA